MHLSSKFNVIYECYAVPALEWFFRFWYLYIVDEGFEMFVLYRQPALRITAIWCHIYLRNMYGKTARIGVQLSGTRLLLFEFNCHSQVSTTVWYVTSEASGRYLERCLERTLVRWVGLHHVWRVSRGNAWSRTVSGTLSVQHCDNTISASSTNWTQWHLSTNPVTALEVLPAKTEPCDAYSQTLWQHLV